LNNPNVQKKPFILNCDQLIWDNIAVRKYNIALIPESCSDLVINCANNFKHISDRYLLGENSFPHVTLYRFSSDASEIEHIIQKINNSNIPKTINLQFNEFSYASFHRSVYWTSLMPDKVDELNHMHYLTSKILGKPVKENFDPHMTLMNTKHAQYESLAADVKQRYNSIRDKFILTIGESDDIGQVTKIICKF